MIKVIIRTCTRNLPRTVPTTAPARAPPAIAGDAGPTREDANGTGSPGTLIATPPIGVSPPPGPTKPITSPAPGSALPPIPGPTTPPPPILSGIFSSTGMNISGGAAVVGPL